MKSLPPPHQALLPIFLTRHFVITLSVNILSSLLFDTGGVYLSMRAHDPPYKMINWNLPWTMSNYAVVSAFFMFLSSSDVHQRIRTGKCRAVARNALRNRWWKRVLLYGQDEVSWKKRLMKFLLCAVLFPGVLLSSFCWWVCWTAHGSLRNGAENSCNADTLVEVVVYNAIWKCIVTTAVVVMNYAGSHNDAAPECQPSTTLPTLASGDGDVTGGHRGARPLRDGPVDERSSLVAHKIVPVAVDRGVEMQRL